MPPCWRVPACAPSGSACLPACLGSGLGSMAMPHYHSGVSVGESVLTSLHSAFSLCLSVSWISGFCHCTTSLALGLHTRFPGSPFSAWEWVGLHLTGVYHPYFHISATWVLPPACLHHKLCLLHLRTIPAYSPATYLPPLSAVYGWVPATSPQVSASPACHCYDTPPAASAGGTLVFRHTSTPGIFSHAPALWVTCCLCLSADMPSASCACSDLFLRFLCYGVPPRSWNLGGPHHLPACWRISATWAFLTAAI